MTKGVKFDVGKRLWRLFRLKDFEPAVRAGEFGAKKYDLYNWQSVDDSQRYEDALLRHLCAYQEGALTDPESGLPVLAHLAWNALVLCWFDRKKRPAAYEVEPNEPAQRMNEPDPKW